MVSLDFELAWGLAPGDRNGYRRNLEGSRTVVPRLLAMFSERRIAATWATVGLLFARSREEARRLSPPAELRPDYGGAEADPYAEALGDDERGDPLHFAPSLVERIHDTPGQEIATHTFSHYYCRSPGQTAEAFRADLAAACAIARERGIEMASIVFPRNQHNPAYDSILKEHGIRAYRGVPRNWTWRHGEPGRATMLARRVGRWIDSYSEVAGPGTYPWEEVLQPSGLSDVRASHFLRPASPRVRRRSALQLRRVVRGLRTAARRGEIYHLWWHPHNFGRHVEENLSFVSAILEEFSRLREEQGMESLTMAGVDAAVRSLEGDPCALR